MTELPRLIGRKEAAAYCGIGESTFSLWVATHKMPPPVPGTRKWDRRAIDARLDEISGLGVNDNEDEFDRLQRESDARKAGVSKPPSDYDDWKQKKQKRREKYRPRLGLDAKLERVVFAMADHPEFDTTDVIPLAGPVFMEILIAKGAVRAVGKDARGRDRFALTKEGKAEVVRIGKWRRLAP